MLAYLCQPNEKANEDLALAYFRKTFGEVFTRQKEASKSDGYVAGLFVLELKGKTNDWLDGLFQGLAYQNRGLDFAQVVVAAKNFLAVWRVEDKIAYACWNDLLIQKRSPTDEEIVTEFLHHWHPKKLRFSRGRLIKALAWMRAEGWVPKGTGKLTSTKF
jgi:hypothetical protein